MRYVELTKNKRALVDDGDFDLVSKYSWHATKSRHNWYANARIGGQIVGMHRLIMGARHGQEVDHRNRKTLDNRRSNLRLADRSSNGANRPKQANNTSGYKGVAWHAEGRCWQAGIKLHGKRIYLGLFRSAKAAARAYDAAAKRYHGDFARPNFR